MAHVLERILAVTDGTYEIIVVDDGSSDETGAIAARYPCRLVRHRKNEGKGRALRSGLATARGEFIVVVDSDDTYPVEAIPRLVEGLATHDVVSGSRTGKPAIPPMNRVGNWLLRAAIRVLYGSAVTDPLTGFYAARRRLLRGMRLSSAGFGIESEIVIKAARMGLRVHNLPIPYNARRGRSKLAPVKDGYRILKTILGHLALCNSTIAFVVPGLTLLAFGLALMLLVTVYTVRVGPVQLSFNSMVGAATVALLGSQITVFGLASNLYAFRHWYPVRDVITDGLLHRHARPWLRTLGFGPVAVGVIWGLHLFGAWARAGFGEFTRTSEAVFVSFLILFGVQMLFSFLFLRLFMGAFQEEEPASEEAPQHAPPAVVVSVTTSLAERTS